MSHISESGMVAHFWPTDHLLPAMILLIIPLLTAAESAQSMESMVALKPTCLSNVRMTQFARDLLKLGFHPICAFH